MKKILGLLLVVFALSSCATVQKINTETTVTGYLTDYTKFMEQGVFISPYTCENKKYQPIGEISVDYAPGIKTVKVQASRRNTKYSAWTYQIEDINYYEAVQKMVDIVKEKGGNAVFNISYKLKEVPLPALPMASEINTYNILTVTGFAVILDE